MRKMSNLSIDLELRDAKSILHFLSRHANHNLGVKEQDFIPTYVNIDYMKASIRKTEAGHYLTAIEDASEEDSMSVLIKEVLWTVRQYSFVSHEGDSFNMAINQERIKFASEILRWATL
jgi:hypothetical protein